MISLSPILYFPLSPTLTIGNWVGQVHWHNSWTTCCSECFDLNWYIHTSGDWVQFDINDIMSFLASLLHSFRKWTNFPGASYWNWIGITQIQFNHWWTSTNEWSVPIIVHMCMIRDDGIEGLVSHCSFNKFLNQIEKNSVGVWPYSKQ